MTMMVIFDEAHKLSASFFGGEVRFTRRYRLAQMLGETTRHLLLLTATPHNGKEEDFQLFLALLDADRFAGRFRDGVHRADAGDLMRRLTKEQLLTFDGTPLFPERIATTVRYVLSVEEHTLCQIPTAKARGLAPQPARGCVRVDTIGWLTAARSILMAAL